MQGACACCLAFALFSSGPAKAEPAAQAGQENPADATTPPSVQRAQVAYSQALAYFDQGDFVNAESAFLEAGEALGTEQSANDAAFNTALTALHAGDDKTFAQYQGLLEERGIQDLVGELLLEQGLFLASNSAANSYETLLQFLAKYPGHPRAADARLALAELYLNEIPAKAVSAREQLESAREQELSPGQRESLDYIAVWIEESDGDYSAVIDRALLFLERWPQAGRAPDIRMKLGQAYYREKDYSQAVNAFEQLAATHPESRLTGPALFSAGRAASLSRKAEDRARAIGLWSRLAENDSDPLALYARHEQGLFKLKREELDEAIATFDQILSHDPPPPLNLKLAVLADRGQAMFSVATARDDNPDHLASAIESFDAILNETGAPASWRNQAAVRKAKCLERLGRREEALATYTDVVRTDRLTEGTNTEAPVAQVEWFFRAGLGAIHLLQEKEQWSEAIQVADSLANSGSPRAIEAARLADRIRLQHFIWDQPEK